MPETVQERYAGAPQPEVMADGRRIYRPAGAVLEAFLLDRSPVAIIRGPWGSGTSTACCIRMWQHMTEQPRQRDGKRRSRWLVIRETYPLLKTTSLETWLQWFPEKLYGKLFTGEKPLRHEIRAGDVEADVLFYAMDDVSSGLLSLEPTGAWFNELEPVPLSLFADVNRRTGRYPSVIEGGSKWSGVIADMNAVPDNHWVPIMMGEAPVPEDASDAELIQYRRPDKWAYFVQPPAMIEVREGGRVIGYETNPDAENLIWLEDGWYDKQIQGVNKRKIDAQILNKIVPYVKGEPVIVSFNDDDHVAKRPIKFDARYPLLIGLDFGRRPAAVFAQRIGQSWFFLDELYAKDMGANRFAPIVMRHIQREYPGAKEIECWGDPKGQDKTQTDERTAYQVFGANGLPVRAPPNLKQNQIRTRIDALDGIFVERNRALLSPRCQRLRAALRGGYRYPDERTGVSDDRKPLKDKEGYSDLADAAQYLVLGGGEGRRMVSRADGQPRGVVQAWRPRSHRRVA